MRKTYITKMPDKAGAFLEASKIISDIGANIVRVSYNKAVDLHTLFIEVNGNSKQIKSITESLFKIGYTFRTEEVTKVILMEFVLEDKAGSLTPVLELINAYKFNISYINSKENNTDYQNFQMGLVIDNADDVKSFLDKASKLCKVNIIEYDNSKKVLDNTVFYLSFANDVASKLNLDKESTTRLIADSNMLMQILDDKGETPFKTFKYITKFADLIAKYKNVDFCEKTSTIKLTDDTNLYVIEPPCGSNTYIIERNNKLLFVDCGFACFKNKMEQIFSLLIKDFSNREKEIIITHPDIDHCGLLDMFKKVYVSDEAYENFRLENEGESNYREQNVLHSPYCHISKILSEYTPPHLSKLCILNKSDDADDNCNLIRLESFTFENLVLDVYSGNGGHVNGEVVIVCEELKLVFTGDITVNIKGFSNEQNEFNLIAPYLMQSVNMDSKKASAERKELLKNFNPNNYIYCCGHGCVMMPN